MRTIYAGHLEKMAASMEQGAAETSANSVADIFESMTYGPAPESDAMAKVN